MESGRFQRKKREVPKQSQASIPMLFYTGVFIQFLQHLHILKFIVHTLLVDEYNLNFVVKHFLV
jgi:hypothetical protein